MKHLTIRRPVSTFAVLTIAAAALTACSSSGGGSSPTSTPSLLDTSTPVTISQEYIPAVTNLLPILAPDYASRFNLTIKSTTAQNVQSEITAATRGDIDVFPGTPAGLLVARDSGAPLVMIASGATGSTQLVTAQSLGVAEGDWTALKTLVDSRKGVDKLKFGSAVAGSANFIECQQSLAQHGIVVGTDVELVTLQNFANQPAALQQRQVDFLCTPEPFATNTIVGGYGSFFATPYDSPSGDILGAIMTTEKTLQDQQKRTALSRYLATLQYAAEQIKADPSIAVKRVMQLANADEAAAQRMLKYTQYTLDISIDKIKAMAKVMNELGQTSNDLSAKVDSFIDTSLLEAASGGATATSTSSP